MKVKFKKRQQYLDGEGEKKRSKKWWKHWTNEQRDISKTRNTPTRSFECQSNLRLFEISKEMAETFEDIWLHKAILPVIYVKKRENPCALRCAAFLKWVINAVLMISPAAIRCTRSCFVGWQWFYSRRICIFSGFMWMQPLKMANCYNSLMLPFFRNRFAVSMGIALNLVQLNNRGCKASFTIYDSMRAKSRLQWNCNNHSLEHGNYSSHTIIAIHNVTVNIYRNCQNSAARQTDLTNTS